jgi:hypothetical protein
VLEVEDLAHERQADVLDIRREPDEVDPVGGKAALERRPDVDEPRADERVLDVVDSAGT